ncbi:MAG TPA: hypothetical protein VGD83_05070 [Streptosporangiaceae bacterium]
MQTSPPPHRTDNLSLSNAAASRKLGCKYSVFSAAFDPNRTTEMTITATDRRYRAANKYADAQRPLFGYDSEQAGHVAEIRGLQIDLFGVERQRPAEQRQPRRAAAILRS